VVTSFGQGHLNAVNPKTDRIHTVYRQLGAASGRMSCGSQQQNTDLAKYKHISPKDCTYPNIQQLPSDAVTRACFNAPKGYLWSSCDYSALESRLGADIYNEPAMIDEYLHGSGDIHSLVAKFCFPKELENVDVKDIASLRPDLRKKAKGPEFAMQFGGSAFAIQGALGCSIEEAEQIAEDYWNGFKGIADFKKKGSDFVRKNGYILMCKYSGHKMYWWDHKEWLKRQQSFTQEFWEEYRTKHKGTGDAIAREVSMHFRAASKWDRMALNSVTQGSGIVILKIAMTNFFKWIVSHGFFGIVELAALVHDESNVIFPEELKDSVPYIQSKCMEEAAALVCTKLPIPAKPDIADHWKH
jgi:DNA polymerase I-like protein with 3'-5' exonuclease and polymerase domains